MKGDQASSEFSTHNRIGSALFKRGAFSDSLVVEPRSLQLGI